MERLRLCDVNSGGLISILGSEYFVEKTKYKIICKKGGRMVEYGINCQMWVDVLPKEIKIKVIPQYEIVAEFVTNNPKTIPEIAVKLNSDIRKAGRLLEDVRQKYKLTREKKNNQFYFCIHDKTKTGFNYNKTGDYTNIGGHLKTIEKYSE